MEFLPTWPLPANTLFFFGFLLFCGALGGFVAHRWPWLPSITGFMLVGFVAGPNVLHLVSHEALAQSHVVVDVALALILYRLGVSLDLKHLRQDPWLAAISLVECVLTFAVVDFALGLVGIHGLQAAVIAAVAISSSPAVLLHVAHELGAAGPVTERAKALLALNNLISFVVFAALLPALYQKTNASTVTTWLAPLYALLGSGVLGAAIGVALHYAARRTKHAAQYQMALVVGAVALTLGAAQMLKLSTLFAPLVLGIVVRSIERKELVADIEFGPAFELFFIALFVYAGANLHLADLASYAPAAAVFVLGRALAKWLGVGAASLACKLPPRAAATTGLMMLPMAGLAIGLVDVTTGLFPTEGAVVGSVVLGAVAVLETFAPPIVARALRWSGDALGAPPDTHGVASSAIPTEVRHG